VLFDYFPLPLNERSFSGILTEYLWSIKPSGWKSNVGLGMTNLISLNGCEM